MVVEPARIITQPEAAYASSAPGSVAPPRVEQAYGQVPGAQPVREANQPVGANGNVATTPASQPSQAGSQAAQPEFDYRALEQERQARLQAEREAAQLRNTVGQVTQFVTQQQRDQQTQQQIQLVLAQAENMPSEQANAFLRNQMLQMTAQERAAAQQMLQQQGQQFEQERKVLAAAPYAEHLLQTSGLPLDLKDRFLRYAGNDPDRMYQTIGDFKADYEERQREISELRGSNVQLARTQEVQALRQAGLAQVGGAAGTGTYQIEVSDDPDVAAQQIWNHVHGLDG